jgi:hypothetical protein
MGLVMVDVVVLHGARVEVGLERVVGVGQVGKRVPSHDSSFSLADTSTVRHALESLEHLAISLVASPD